MLLEENSTISRQVIARFDLSFVFENISTFELKVIYFSANDCILLSVSSLSHIVWSILYSNLYGVPVHKQKEITH